MKIETFSEYQSKAVELKVSLNRFFEIQKHNNIPEDVKLLLAVVYDGLGLGEAGEVQGKIKKIIRDGGGRITHEDVDKIKDELSDVLWYVASMCDTLNIKMEDVATRNIEKLQSRHARGTVHGSGDNR